MTRIAAAAAADDTADDVAELDEGDITDADAAIDALLGWLWLGLPNGWHLRRLVGRWFRLSQSSERFNVAHAMLLLMLDELLSVQLTAHNVLDCRMLQLLLLAVASFRLLRCEYPRAA